MKKLLSFSALLVLVGGIYSFTLTNSTTAEEIGITEDLKWYTWEEAVEANKKEQKKIFVDVYTDWCGWCKRMDKATFNDEKVKTYIRKNFYPVKLNAEQKADINFNGHTFKWVEGGRRGIHTLAYSLLDGQMSYPSVVFLTEDFERIAISPGFKNAEQFLDELKFAAEEQYKN